jgi:hypothetical protein
VAVALVAVSGCSRFARDPDPAQLLSTAKANATAAESVHMTGSGGCNGTAFSTDMQLRKDGSGAGTVTLAGQKVSVVTTKDALYVNAPKEFWTSQSGAKAAALIGSHWVSLPKTGNVCLAVLGSKEDVVANYLGYDGTPALLAGSSFKGTPAHLVGIGSSTGFWIADESGLPLAVKDTAAQTDVTFSDWGADVTVTVPPASDVVASTSLPKA